MKRFDLFCLLIGILGATLTLVLVIFALNNSMVADDYAYFSYLQDSGVGGFLHWHFFEHSGRLIQGLLAALGWMIGGAASVQFMPIVTLFGLIAAMSWAVWRFSPMREKPRKLQVVGIGAALASLTVLLMPSLFDTYLWWTSNSVHLVGVTLLILSCCFVDMLLREKLSWQKRVLILVALFFGQLCSENVAVLTVAAAGLGMAYCWWKKLKQKKIVSIVFAVLTAGLLALYFSPGSMARRGSEMGLGFDFSRIFLESIRHMKVFVVAIEFWQIALILLMAALLSFVVMKPGKKLLRKISLGIILVVGAALYVTFVMFGYIGHGMNYRSFTVPSMILMIGVVMLLAFWLTRVRATGRQLLAVGCLAIGAVGLFGFAKYHVDFLAMRQVEERSRDASVREQVREDSPEVLIVELPVLIDNSEAVDITANIAGRNMWFEKYFRRYYHISDEVFLPVLPMSPEYSALYYDNFNFLNDYLERWQNGN